MNLYSALAGACARLPRMAWCGARRSAACPNERGSAPPYCGLQGRNRAFAALGFNAGPSRPVFFASLLRLPNKSNALSWGGASAYLLFIPRQ